MTHTERIKVKHRILPLVGKHMVCLTLLCATMSFYFLHSRDFAFQWQYCIDSNNC